VARLLEVGDVQRFSSIKKAISYCGLCGAEKSSGNTVQRTPLSKQRNKHLQTTLIEAAKMAPRNSPALAMLFFRLFDFVPHGLLLDAAGTVRGEHSPKYRVDSTHRWSDRILWCPQRLIQARLFHFFGGGGGGGGLRGDALSEELSNHKKLSIAPPGRTILLLWPWRCVCL
jgi:hypothetical protein